MTEEGMLILMVEDSVDDAEATRRALRKAGLVNPIAHVMDGDEALDFLYRRGQFADAQRPGLIMLDLNLPGLNGREVLAVIKGDPSLHTIPVIVLTTSLDERDIEGCYQAGANTYVHKPVAMTGFIESMQRLADFWFRIAVIPKS